MYVSGTISDYECRLHELPTGLNDIANFVTEGQGYVDAPFLIVSGVLVSGVWPAISGKWEQELRLQKYRVSNNPAALTGQLL